MITVEADISESWPEPPDWAALAQTACEQALSVSASNFLLSKEYETEISVCFSDNDTVHDLNKTWRDKDRPTNVLSFPMMEAEELATIKQMVGSECLLGDIILAFDVAKKEALEKGISLENHVTHLITHGTLHLLGYDHIVEAEAEEMEGLERKALAILNIADPYPDDEPNKESLDG
ncbi:putative rRNA maturation factor [Zymomonas mobilis]|uniref:Endoribonuclease YbeY n=1 Tax=Zymomonas mobilis TaxID=542 RepID=A0A542VZ72_ZYMMB|nr:rRNA maturation RNase YbeY [Zymomonas mobilis]TQL16620.1 putative rRNA maturation factor [Zymomonas mobilis]